MASYTPPYHTNPADKPAHAIDSPLLAFPGYVVLPDPDAVTEETWEVWERCVRDAGTLADGNARSRFDLAAALFVVEAGQWHIQGVDATALAVPATARISPLKVRKWLSRVVERYWLSITDPKA